MSSTRSWCRRLVACACLITAFASAGVSQSDLVRIEDMTWEEVADAIRSGKTTAVYYAGSIEQNGPHMAFGKHGLVAQRVGERIVRVRGGVRRGRGGAGEGKGRESPGPELSCIKTVA